MPLARVVGIAAVVLGAGLGPLAGAASAQHGVDVETFRPAVDGYGIFTVERAETGQKWDVGFRLFTDYAHAPLVLAMKDAAGAAADRTVMDYQVAIHAGMHLSLASWLELALVLPLSAQGYGAAGVTRTNYGWETRWTSGEWRRWNRGARCACGQR